MNLTWPNCRNVRDLGGLPAADGGRISPGALIRADRLSRLTPDGMAAVEAAGVSRIVDLRRPAECAERPSPFATQPSYRNVPVQEQADVEDMPDTLDDFYLTMLDRRPHLFTAAVAAIADAPPGGVVVHCHIGKDRTGVIVALALTVAGVPADVVADDYAYSAVRLAEAKERELASTSDEARRHRLVELWSARPETIGAALTHLATEYGGVERYLADGGLTTAQLDRLRARLLCSPDGADPGGQALS